MRFQILVHGNIKVINRACRSLRRSLGTAPGYCAAEEIFKVKGCCWRGTVIQSNMPALRCAVIAIALMALFPQRTVSESTSILAPATMERVAAIDPRYFAEGTSKLQEVGLCRWPLGWKHDFRKNRTH